MNPTLTLLTALPLAPLAVLDAAEPVTIDLAQRTWQGIPGLERTAKGRVFVSWFTGGPKEPAPENTILLSYSDDGGKTFTPPEAIALPTSDGTRVFDPSLWIDPKGRLWYIVNRGNKDIPKHDVWACICDDPDATPPAFGAEFRVGYDAPYAFRLQKPTVLTSGEWIMPVTHAQEPIHEWFAGPKQLQGVGISTDEGRTWKLHGALKAPEWALECMITELCDGRLWMLIRTGSGFLWESHSSDKGRTWSEAKTSTIANPGSRFFIRRLASGNLLLVNHYTFTGRSHLTAQLSTDDGATWNEGLLLDERGAVSYPDGVQDRDGLIWITYDRDRGGAGEILLAKFREKDVVAGKDVSGTVLLKQIIDKLDKPGHVPAGWDAALAGDQVMDRLVRVSAPQVKGAHDAEFVCVGDRAYIVEHDNDVEPGHGAGEHQYCVLSVVDLKTLAVEKVIPMAKSGQAFVNETLPVGMCFVPRVLKIDDRILRCYFASQGKGYEEQMWYRDFDLCTQAFAGRIHKAKLKTPAGVFDMQPSQFHVHAVTQGFRKPAVGAGLYIFDSFKRFDGKTYVALNNFPGKQNALARLHDDFVTFEIIGHYNEPQSQQLSESAVNRLPDGTWMAICRNDLGNYHFTTSRDGQQWTVGREMPFVQNGLNSKPTFDKFGGVYYLGWQEATRIAGCNRSVFNLDISHDGRTWERKYRFETPESFQYPTFHEHDGVIWLSVSQSDHKGSTDRIMFGKLEDVGQFESQAGKKRTAWPEPPVEPAVMKRGVKLFTDRDYAIDEMPEAVSGLPFLRTSIEKTDVTVTKPGTLCALTPTIRPTAASQEDALQKAGFTKVEVPETHLFPGEINRVSLYRKIVKTGERLQFKKMVLLISAGAEVEIFVPEPPKPWSMNNGEKLYNGIVLPEVWPPEDVDTQSDGPMPVPYLDHPPAAVAIDVGRQLFVDDFLIEKTDLLQMYHLPEKYAGNPVLKAETALERQTGILGGTCRPCVWWNPGKQTFDMWYQAGTYFRGTIALATSQDGCAWTRPALDVFPGSNQALPPGFQPDSYGIVPDWSATDPQQRFKLFATTPGNNQSAHSFTSADGVHWTNHVSTGRTGDRSSMFYNPFRKKWVYSLRSSFRGRSRNYWECGDFLAGAKWGPADPVPWTAADCLDAPEPGYKHKTQLYNLDAVAYESLMLGFFELHRGPENDRCEKMGLPKLNEICFGYSRDGFHWSRPDRRAHIPASRRDTWDCGFIEGGGNICVIVGDKLYFYHSGCRGDMDSAVRSDGSINGGSMYDPNCIGVSILRRDGFASLMAGASAGSVTTRPVLFSGRRLFVNADCPQGELRAEILDAAGRPIEPFTLANCIPVAADKTLALVAWRNGADLSAVADQPVRLRFSLRRGHLYAFWVSRDASGRSDGYVAGGGPGYTGSTDTIGALK